MNPETTLNAVRELSENATLRPGRRRLRLGGPKAAGGLKRAEATYEELHPPAMLGIQGRASGRPGRSVPAGAGTAENGASQQQRPTDLGEAA